MAPDETASSLKGLLGSFMALSLLSLMLRFCARYKQKLPLQWDDWTMFISVMFFLVYTSMILYLIYFGILGWGSFPFPASEWPQKYYKMIKIMIIADVFLFLTATLVKVSALLLYERIFCSRELNKRLHGVIVVTIVVLVAWLITFCFLAGIQCGGSFKNDLQKAEDDKNCRMGFYMPYGLYISDMLLDLWVILLPVYNILRLHLTPIKKISTIGIFVTALAAVATSIIRLVDFLRIDVFHTKISNTTDEEDFNTRLYFYNTLELWILTISINMPVLWGLFSSYTPELIMKMARSMTSLVSGLSAHSDSHDPAYALGSKLTTPSDGENHQATAGTFLQKQTNSPTRNL